MSDEKIVEYRGIRNLVVAPLKKTRKTSSLMIHRLLLQVLRNCQRKPNHQVILTTMTTKQRLLLTQPEQIRSMSMYRRYH